MKIGRPRRCKFIRVQGSNSAQYEGGVTATTHQGGTITVQCQKGASNQTQTRIVDKVQHLGDIPISLTQLGNAKAWREMLSHVQDVNSRSDPIVLWGPTGCGKTCGVRTLFKAMKYHLIELDGADADDTKQLIHWIKRFRYSKAILKNSAILLDDFESLTTEGRSLLISLLKRTSGQKNLCPLVVTCTQLKEPTMSPLQMMHSVRMFSPSEHVCQDWFESRGFTVDDCNGSCVQMYPAHNWHVWNGNILKTGDLRRINISLKWKSMTKKTLYGKEISVQDPLLFVNIFQSTQQLFKRSIQPHVWSEHAQTTNMDLLCEHVPRYVLDIKDLSLFCDTLSVVDSTQPLRFETSVNQIRFNLYTVALGTTLSLIGANVRDVGALAPPPRRHLVRGWDRNIQGGKRPCNRLEWLDTPTLLRGM